jgi:predicted nucleotide-binding protein
MRQGEFASGIPRTITMLEGLIDTVREHTDNSRLGAPEIAPVDSGAVSTDVFVVRGREDGPREVLARFIARMGLNPIILHEQPSEGRTVIEKIERHSNCGLCPRPPNGR